MTSPSFCHRLALGSSAVTRSGGIVYVACDLEERVAYVGQTVGRYGVLAHWFQHFSDPESEFRRRLNDWDEDAFTRLCHLVVAYWFLRDTREFAGLESSYREGVEYLVQVGLNTLGVTKKPALRLISSVQSNPTVHFPIVTDAAEQILSCISRDYPAIFDT